MDGRYLLGAILLFGLGVGLDAVRWTHNAGAWSVPFVGILLFLAFIGDSPARQALEWVSDEPLPRQGER